MKYMSKKEFESQMRKVKLENESKERKQKLKEEKRKHKYKLKLPSTSKLVLLVVFLICIEILIFSQYAMIKTGDISAMYTLISVPIALVPVCLGYYWKSKHENTAGGIVFESSMSQMNQYNGNFGADELVNNTENINGSEAVG